MFYKMARYFEAAVLLSVLLGPFDVYLWITQRTCARFRIKLPKMIRGRVYLKKQKTKKTLTGSLFSRPKATHLQFAALSHS